LGNLEGAVGYVAHRGSALYVVSDVRALRWAGHREAVAGDSHDAAEEDRDGGDGYRAKGRGGAEFVVGEVGEVGVGEDAVDVDGYGRYNDLFYLGEVRLGKRC
jgi:hypothetical protein